MLGFRLDSPVKTFALVIIILAIIGLLLYKNSYSLMRVMVNQETRFRTADFEEMQTEHFIIKYTTVDKDSVNMVAEASEYAYAADVDSFGEKPKAKTTVVIYPDSASLAKSFGWDRNEKAMGVYWGGTIRILSPRAWVKGNQQEEKAQFMKEGPMVHEFAHLMVDQISRGNYNRWWTEGIAQYVEKKITGFEFSNPFINLKAKDYYSLEQMGKNFDSLDQQVAYWESLQAVEFLAKNYGEDSLMQILSYQGEGDSMPRAIEKVTGITYQSFEKEFYSSMQLN